MPHKGTPIRYGLKHRAESSVRRKEILRASATRITCLKQFAAPHMWGYVSNKTKFQCRVTFRLAVTKIAEQCSSLDQMVSAGNLQSRCSQIWILRDTYDYQSHHI